MGHITVKDATKPLLVKPLSTLDLSRQDSILELKFENLCFTNKEGYMMLRKLSELVSLALAFSL